VKYIRRTDKDGDVYFFFNESAETQSRTATLSGTGAVQIWDPNDGTIHPLAGVAPAQGSVDVPLVLAPHESKFVVIGTLPPGAGQPLPTLASSQTLQALDGNWSITLGETHLDSPLKSWQELGGGTFNGIAQYSKTFDVKAPVAGQRIYLDLGNASEIAHIKLNGKDFDSRAWPAYVWDVTDSIKTGTNTLEVEVQVPAAGGRGPGGGARAGAGRGAGAGGGGAAGRAAGPGGGAAAGGGGAGAGRGRGAGAGGGGVGGPAPEAAPTTGHGLLGPVRLIAQ
jgi:hypothetical protein